MRTPAQMMVTAILAIVLTCSWAAGAPKVQMVTLTLWEHSFTPERLVLNAGVPVELTIANEGKLTHEVHVYDIPRSRVKNWDAYTMAHTYFRDMGEIGIEFGAFGAVAGTRIFEVELNPGKRAKLKFTPTRKGTFEMACHVQGHYEAGMAGRFVVR